MNTQKGNSNYRGFGFYLILILTVVLMWYFIDGRSTTNAYTRSNFEEDVNNGVITSYHVVQKREIPTGYVIVSFTSDTINCF